MKELAVKNYKTAEGQKISQGGNEFTVKPIVEQTDVDQCRVNFVEVEPGNFVRIRKSWFILTSIRITFRRLYIFPIQIR